ncbi:MAG: hypothetical protein IPP88_21165 [Betaproteobacteria bacterium]|nr:hypothetical protein [Betaproteobacteria bacterium]
MRVQISRCFRYGLKKFWCVSFLALAFGPGGGAIYAQQLPADCVEMGGTNLCSMPLVGDWTYAFGYSSLPVQECQVLPFSGFRSEEGMLSGTKDFIYCAGAGYHSTPGYPAVRLCWLDFKEFYPSAWSEEAVYLGYSRIGKIVASWNKQHWLDPNVKGACNPNISETASEHVRTRTVICPDGYQTSPFTNPPYCFRPQVTDCPDCTKRKQVGNPVAVDNGAKIEMQVDYSTSGAFPLQIKRHYNSFGSHFPFGSTKRQFPFGDYWKSSYDGALVMTTGTGYQMVTMFRPEGDPKWFRFVGGAWVGRLDESGKLIQLTDASSVTIGWKYIAGNNRTRNL